MGSGFSYNGGMSPRLRWVLGLGVLAVAAAFVFARTNGGRKIPDQIPIAALLQAVPEDLKFAPADLPPKENSWAVMAEALESMPTVGYEANLAIRGEGGKGVDLEKELARFDTSLTALMNGAKLSSTSISSLEGPKS